MNELYTVLLDYFYFKPNLYIGYYIFLTFLSQVVHVYDTAVFESTIFKIAVLVYNTAIELYWFLDGIWHWFCDSSPSNG